MSYITKGDALNFLQTETNAYIDAGFATWLSAIETFIEKFTGKEFEQVVADTRYFDGNGKKTQTFKNVKENDLSQIFFTKLIRRKKQEDRRFTFTESNDKELIINFYINKSPQSVAEARSRYGEVFYGSKKEKQNE